MRAHPLYSPACMLLVAALRGGDLGGVLEHVVDGDEAGSLSLDLRALEAGCGWVRAEFSGVCYLLQRDGCKHLCCRHCYERLPLGVILGKKMRYSQAR